MAPASWAGTCSSKTGGSTNTVMWTGKSYTCAYEADNGNNKIGSWNTEFFTSSTAMGYEKRYSCSRQSGGVTITYIYADSAGTGLGSSITFTATNWEDGSRHWTAAVLWNTPKGGTASSTQYYQNCTDYKIRSNLFYVSKASLSGPVSAPENTPTNYTITVTAPDGGGPASGTVALFRQQGSSPSPKGKNCDGTPNSGVDSGVAQGALSSAGTATLTVPALAAGSYTFYGVYAGKPVTSSSLPGYCLTPPQTGLTPATTNSITLVVGDPTPTSGPADVVPAGMKSLRSMPAVPSADSVYVSIAEARGTGDLSVRCPRGQAVQSMYAGSSGMTFAPQRFTPSGDGTGVRLRGRAGVEAMLQVACRPVTSKAVVSGKIGRGSIGPDRMTSRKPGGLITGGLGADRLVARDRRTALDGGFGNDHLVVKAGESAATGGFGNDVLEARADKVLLVGGLGADRFATGTGLILVNARDGQSGDVVVCGSSLTRVRADKGDVLIGPCTVA